MYVYGRVNDQKMSDMNPVINDGFGPQAGSRSVFEAFLHIFM